MQYKKKQKKKQVNASNIVNFNKSSCYIICEE